MSPLMFASRNGDTMAISLLLKHDAGMLDVPNPRGATALFVASFEGHAAAVTLLLNAGAAVDRSKSDGATPLAGACHSGRAIAMSRDCTAWGGVEVGWCCACLALRSS